MSAEAFPFIAGFALLLAFSIGGAVGALLWAHQTRERTSFRPLGTRRPAVVPQLGRHELERAVAWLATAAARNDTFAPLPRQGTRRPGAPCFICGEPLGEGHAEHND